MKKFVVFDAQSNDFEEFDCYESALNYANELLDGYRNEAYSEGWADFDEFICIYEKKSSTQKQNIKYKKDCNVDEYGYCKDCDEHWNDDWEYKCDYEIAEIKELER